MTAPSETTDRIEDRDCPNCGGELQRQDNINITCLACDGRYSHHIENGDHLLITPDNKVVLRV